jgi:hypothetical protein
MSSVHAPANMMQQVGPRWSDGQRSEVAAGVYPRRSEQPKLVVEPKRLRRQTGLPSEISDVHQIHVCQLPPYLG